MSLNVSRLSKRFGDKWLLRDVSFNAERGKITGLFGESGSGKSTVLKAIAGIENAGGSVFLGSRDVTSLTREDRRIYFAELQTRSFLSRLMRNDDSDALSAGERSALSLSRAVESPADVLLLDDPFCSMDELQRQEFTSKLRQTVISNNLTVVLATSDFRDVFMVCDYVSILVGGEIEQTGTPKDVYSVPASFKSARLTGPNNLFEARRLTSSKSDNPQFQTLAGELRLGVKKIERSGLAAINQNVWLGIRPEHISIAFGASFPEDNLLKAVITGVQLLGSTTMVELDANGLMLQALVLRLVGLHVGDECMLGLPPDRIQILKN